MSIRREAPIEGKRIVLIEDVVSSGCAIIDAANMLRGDRIEVDGALCVIDRQTGGFEKLKNVGISLGQFAYGFGH